MTLKGHTQPVDGQFVLSHEDPLVRGARRTNKGYCAKLYFTSATAAKFSSILRKF
eukprot:SAG31_NODE_33377_length_344_cov_1.048980_1_plen_54_part_10